MEHYVYFYTENLQWNFHTNKSTRFFDTFCYILFPQTKNKQRHPGNFPTETFDPHQRLGEIMVHAEDLLLIQVLL